MRASGYLLLRRGRVLTPWSRTRYRWVLLRTGHALFQSAGDSDLSVVLVPAATVIRIATLPLLAFVDVLWWPLARATVDRGPWWVVRVEFDGPDAQFVRVAEASTRTDAEVLRRQFGAG